MLCCVPFRPLCGLTKYAVVGTALGLTLTVCMPAVGPGDSHALFSCSHWCRSTEVRSQDCSSCGPVGAKEAAQTLVWPNPCMYVPTEPTAAKARPVSAAISAARTLVVLSDVSQAQNLGGRQQSCNSLVGVAVRRDFSSSSLVTQPLGLSWGFSHFSGHIS